MRVRGVVDSVEIRRSGSFTSSGSTTLAAATSLPVNDMSDFREDGGQAIIGTDVVDYDAATSDPELGDFLSIPAGLPADVADRTAVYVYPVHLRKFAHAILDTDPTGDPVEAEVPSGHFWTDSRLAETVTGGQHIELEVHPGRRLRYTVADLPGADPVVDGGFLDGDLPMTPGAFTTAMDELPEEFANRVRPDSLQSGEVSADVRVTGSWTTGGLGAQGSVVQDAQGLFTVQPDGTPRTVFPNDPDQPDQHRGDGHFQRLSSNDTASFTGQATVEAESDLVLASAEIAAPTAVPTVTPYWPTQQYPGPQKFGNKSGLAFDSINGFAKTLIIRTRTEPVIAEWRLSDLLYFDTHRFTSPTGTIAGIAWSNLNDRLITLEWDAGWQVRYWDRVGGNYDYDPSLSWSWTDGDPLNATNLPAICCREDSGADRVVIAQSQVDGTVTFYPYDDAVAAAPVATTTPLDAGNLVGVADLSTQYAVAAEAAMVDADGAPQLAIVDASTGVVRMIPAGNGNPACAGLARLETDTVPSSFHYLSRADHAIIRHLGADQTGYWWAQCAYRDISSGDETTPGPAVRFTATAGAALMVSMPGLPPQADAINVYIGPGTTQPANALMGQQGLPTVPGETTRRVLVIVTGGGNPHTVGTLMGTRSGRIVGEDGSAAIDGSYSNAHTLDYRLALVEAGGGYGGRTIDGGLM